MSSWASSSRPASWPAPSASASWARILGKVRNLSHRSNLSDELAGVIAPNTTGLIVFAQDEAVVEIEKALAKADRIVSKAVDQELAKEIDREAALAKEAVGAD